MKRKLLLNACIVFFFFQYATAQDIFIVAYKGTITFSDGRVLDHNFRYAVDRGVSTTFDIEASALVFTKDKYFTIEKMSIKTPYSYAQFVNTFNTAQKNNGFGGYLQKTHLFSTEVKESSKGAVVAGIKAIDNEKGRFVKDVNETIFPQDSVKLLTNRIQLKWETAGKIFGAKLIVVNAKLNDTVYNSTASNKGEVDLVIEKEGTYKWFLFSKMENKKAINRIFIKPSVAEGAQLQDDLEKFKKQIASLSEELRPLVLEDYLYQTRIVE